MRKIVLIGPLLLLAGISYGQIIKEIKQVTAGQEKPIVRDVFDTRANLRVYWDRDELNKRLAEFAPATNLSAEIQRAGKLAEISVKGLAAVRALNEAVASRTTTLTDEQLNPLVIAIGRVLRDAIQIAGRENYQRLENAFNQPREPGVPQREQKIANIGRQAGAVFAELLNMSEEEYARIAEKIKQSNVNFWVVADVSRDEDPTRTREVPFLSPLSADDVRAMNAVRDFAEKFGGEPSGLMKEQLKSARDAAKKVLEDAKKGLEDEAKKVADKWKAVYDTYKDDIRNDVKTALGNVETAAKALQTKLSTSVDELKAALEHITEGDPATRADAIARLQEVSTALSSARATLGGLAEVPALVTNVRTAFTQLTTALGTAAGTALEGFKALLDTLAQGVDDLKKKLEATIEGIAKGGVQTLFDALGIGLHMKKIAEIVKQGDSARDHADLDMTNNNGQPLRLLAGDEIVVGIKIAKATTPPASFVESRKLYAYPDRWTSDRLIPIVFTQRTDTDATTGRRRESWRFSPTYMDVFKRYSTSRSADSNRWFTPGIGIAVTALDQNGDDSFEIGFGLGVTFLDDRLMGGIGFNTQSNRSYAFFGLRLRLGDIGIKG